MPKILEKELKESIKKETYRNLYLLFGEEEYLTKYYTNTLIAKILKNNYNDFNFYKFNDSTFDINKIYDCIEIIPFTSDKKCILISNVNIENIDSDNMQKLNNTLSNIPDTTTIIFMQTDDNIKNPKTTKWSAFTKSVNPLGDIVEFKKLDQNALEQQIIQWCEKLNSKISLNNTKKLIEYCGENLNNLKNQIKKLTSLCYNQEITTYAIESLADRKLESSAFELAKLIIAEKYQAAYKKLNTLISKKEEPILILSAISSSYIDIYRMKIAIQSKVNSGKLKEYFDYKGKEFRLEIAKKNCSKLSITNIREILKLLIKADIKLKSSKLSSKFILEELITKITLTLN